MVGDPPVAPDRTRLETNTERSISTRERDAVVRRIAEATRSPKQQYGTDPYAKYIQPLARKITANRLDAEAIEVLAPEVKTAKEIVIPSIISPSDMRDGEIGIRSTSKLVTDEENDRISKILHEHFNDKLKLSVKLPTWIHEGLYGAGSQPLLVLPVTEVDTIINDPTAILTKISMRATEALDIERQAVMAENVSIFGISDSAHTSDVKALSSELKPAVESLVSNYLKSTPDLPQTAYSYDFARQWSDTSKGELQTFAKQAIEQLNIVDNPDVLKIDRARKASKSADLTSKLVNVYKTTTLITVNPESKPSIGDPIIYELPPECVIPIFTPGTPTDHIGYFILLDEHGNPLHLSASGPILDLSDNRTVTPSGLYKSFGFDLTTSIKHGQLKNEQSELMMNVYQTIVEAHLKTRLKNSGLTNIYIGAPESVYRCLFSRYLALRKTRLLFVPRDLMTYMCYRYNKDGTGRSKIEDIKFILSLKITILICRVMASMNSAINRRKLTVNFTENMGDPVAFFQQLEKEAIDKSVMNFTYDPTEITRTLAQKSITVAAKGIPGAENYEITTEPNESRDIRPDDSLITDLDNLLVLGLDLPPSAFNLLNENEFSRSVATNNLFFCRRISSYQKPTCEHVANHVKIYTHMSETLKTKIRDVLSSGSSKTGASESTDAGTVDDKPSNIDKKLVDVIANITAVLPAPSIAPSKTEFEELDTIIASINTTLEAIFDNDLGSSDDNPMSMIRAHVKETVLRDYMSKIGVMRDVSLPDISDPKFLEHIHTRKLQLLNLVSGLKQAVVVTQPSTGADQSTGGFGDQSTGGSPDQSTSEEPQSF